MNTNEGLPNALIRRGAFGNSGSKDIGADDTALRLKEKNVPPELLAEYERIAKARDSQIGFSALKK